MTLRATGDGQSSIYSGTMRAHSIKGIAVQHSPFGRWDEGVGSVVVTGRDLTVSP